MQTRKEAPLHMRDPNKKTNTHLLALYLTVLVGILSIVIYIVPLRPINVLYTVTFSTTHNTSSTVTFVFDKNKQFPSSSSQNAQIVNNKATIRLDPLNQRSKSLSLAISNSDQRILSFSASTMKSDFNYGHNIITIKGNQLKQDKATPQIYHLGRLQLKEIQSATEKKSSIKPTLWFAVILIYIFAIARLTKFKSLPRKIFAACATGILILLYFLISVWTSSDIRRSYKILVTLIVISISAALYINSVYSRSRTIRARKNIIIIDYLGILAYSALQSILFRKQLGGFADEPAHLSYIAYMKLHGGFIPDFRQMRIYSTGSSSNLLNLSPASKGQFNYLGHPPLYYKLMSIIGGMQVHGTNVSYNITQLRNTSFIIGIIGILILFHIAFTRLERIPLLHLLFGFIIISPANMIFGLSGISNDTLALLTVSIFLLGFIRFYEKKYNTTTFMLIAIGITSSILTKLTAGLIVTVISFLALGHTLYQDHSFTLLRRASFFTTLPIYLLIPAYFGPLYFRFHTIQPSYQRFAFAEYVKSGMYVPLDQRGSMTFLSYFQYFIKMILSNWSSIVGHVPVIRNSTTPLTIDAVAITIIFLSPFLIFAFKKTRIRDYLSMFSVSLLITILYQFRVAATSFFENGYLGGTQSRYYQCAIGFFALTLLWIISNILTVHDSNIETSTSIIKISNNNNLSDIGVILISGYILLLMYNGFISTFLLSGR